MGEQYKKKVILYAKGTATGDTELKATAPADGLTPNAGAQEVTAFLEAFNGSGFDRIRNNTQVTLLTSAVRNSNTDSADQVNYNARGVIVVFDVTAVPGTDTVECMVQMKNVVSGNYLTLVSSGAVSSVFTYKLVVYPGSTDVDSRFQARNDVPLPRTWRVHVIHSGTGDFTYSVSAYYLI